MATESRGNSGNGVGGRGIPFFVRGRDGAEDPPSRLDGHIVETYTGLDFLGIPDEPVVTLFPVVHPFLVILTTEEEQLADDLDEVTDGHRSFGFDRQEVAAQRREGFGGK